VRAREGRAVRVDESLFAESVVAMRIDIVGETKSFQCSKVEDPLFVEEISVDAALPLLDSVGVAVFKKAVVKQSSRQGVSFGGGFSIGYCNPFSCLKCRLCRHRLLLLRKLGWKGLIPFWVVAALPMMKRVTIPGFGW
jgi:hypothetical protein